MKFLLDTHLLLRAAVGDAGIRLTGRLSATARNLIEDEANELFFSPASIWEVAVKNALGRPDFRVDPHLLRRALLDNGYVELPISGSHAAAVANLPDHHRDPFDRMLVAQATVEGIVLLTNDAMVAAYHASPVRLVKV